MALSGIISLFAYNGKQLTSFSLDYSQIYIEVKFPAKTVNSIV